MGVFTERPSPKTVTFGDMIALISGHLLLLYHNNVSFRSSSFLDGKKTNGTLFVKDDFNPNTGVGYRTGFVEQFCWVAR